MTGAALGRVMIEIDGEGPPVLFVHGLGGTSNSFQTLLGALAGFRCLRPDLPGSGRSPTPFGKLTMNGFAETIGEIIRHFAGAPVHLVGHSMGTAICQRVAAKMPDFVASLTLFGPILEPPDAARQRLRDRGRASPGRTGMIAIADAALGGLSSTTRARTRSPPPSCARATCGRTRRASRRAARRWPPPTPPTCASCAAPTLLVTGDEDSVAPPTMAQAIADKVKGATVRILERCGHWTPIERPQDCARLLGEHVRAHGA
jgi:3-oxoadipate enol-lactonase